MKEIYVVNVVTSNDGITDSRAFVEREKATNYFNIAKNDLLGCMSEMECYFKIICNDVDCFWIKTDSFENFVQFNKVELFEEGE